MQQTDKAFTGSIPALYEKHLVPMFFAPYAHDLVDRLADLETGRVLELAAGTGVVTRGLATSLPQDVEIVATDLNPAMLEMAARTVRDPRISWKPADACALPFGDGEFDAVVCQFGAMFFPDKARGYSEARRVLRPGGRFIFNVWDRLEDNEFGLVATEAVAAMFPKDPPQFLRRTPHGYFDADRIRADLKDGGFARMETQVVEHWSESDTPMTAAIGLCQGTPLRNEIEARDASRLEEATDETAHALSKRFGHGPIRGRMKAIVVTAWN